MKSMDQKDRLDLVSGTSFAAPIVWACIAVARTLLKKELTQSEILDSLSKSAIDMHDLPANVGSGSLSILDFFKAIQKLLNIPSPEGEIEMKSCFKKNKGII